MPFGKSNFVGVSISRDYVKATVVRILRRQPVGIRGGVLPTPPNAYQEGRIVDREAVAQALQEMWEEHGIPGSEAVVGISSPQVLFRVLNYPRMPFKELQNAIRYDLDSHFPLEPQEAVFDCTELRVHEGPEGERSEVLVVAAPKTLAESYALTMEKARVQAVALEPEPLALLRVLALDSESVSLLVSAGTTHSSVMIVEGSELLFARVVPWGSEDLQVGGGPQLEAARRELVLECSRSLEYYQVQSPGQPAMPEKVLVCGEALDSHPYLVQYVGDELGLPAEQVSSILDWEATVEPDDRPRVTVCAGLALREVRGYGWD